MNSRVRGQISEAIGWNLRAARLQARMTIEELSAKVDKLPRTVYGWESDGFASSVDVLADLHEILGLPLWELVPTEEEVRDL